MTSYKEENEREEKLLQLVKPLFEKIKKNKEIDYMYFVIPNLFAKKTIVYANMHSDLSYLKSCLDELKKFKDQKIIARSLWTTIISLYGRQFTDSTTTSSPKLEEKDCFQDTSADIYKMHQKLMSLRHNFISHRGKNYQEHGICYLKIHKKMCNEEVHVEQVLLSQPQNEECLLINNLINHLLEVAREKYRKAAHKSRKSMLENFTDEELVKGFSL